MRVLKGCYYVLSDGSYCYNGLVDERCLWHFMKNFFNKWDDGLIRMKGAEMFPWIISQHTQDIYSIAREEYVRHLQEKHLWLLTIMKYGTMEFVGATTTNAMGGGNWRVKYEFRVPYHNAESAFARALLIELRDSLCTFRHGDPEESFAHGNGVFSYSRMTTGEPAGDPPSLLESDLAQNSAVAAG